MKTTKEFCSYCRKEYEAEKGLKVFGIQLPKAHNCKEQKRFYRAKAKVISTYQ